MCGIAGIIQLNDDRSHLSKIEEMTARAAHRGPDGQGVFISGKVAFGHRRLSIIDLTNRGAQPMSDELNQYHITYNGEIYNYLEIKQQLVKYGYSFRGDSDTEVLLTAYRHWGEACVSKFNGMWSFAILDCVRNVVFSSRDRIGEKPFYFHRSPEQFLFASEIRQILPEMLRITGNRAMLDRFLFGVSGEDFSDTFFKGVHKLPAGHNMVFDLSTDQMRVYPFYNLEETKVSVPQTFEAQAEAFQELFSDSVRLRLRSDVTVGTCLSGGLDSSSIACIAASYLSETIAQPFKAITAVSTDRSRDESGFAKVVAEANGLDLYLIKPEYEQFRSKIRNVVKAQEEPFGTASIFMQYEVMSSAKANSIKVLLDGQGADELLLGYERYFAPYMQQLIRRRKFKQLWQQAKNINANNAFVSFAGLAKYYGYFNSSSIRKWRLRQKFHFLPFSDVISQQVESYALNSRDLSDLQRSEITHSNLPPLLRFEDKNAMWHSVETRLPYLDHRLIEFCLSLPVESKIAHGWTKYILRHSMEKKMPEEIVWRTNKFGFEAPQSSWVQAHTPEMLKVISSSLLVQTLLASETHVKQAVLIPELLWKLYIISLWEDEFKVTDIA